MRKDKKQASPESGAETQTPWLSIAPGITVIAAVMLALFAVVFVLLWRSGMLPSYLGGLFSPSGGKTGLLESTDNEISLGGDAGQSFSGENFYTPDFSDVAGNKDKITELLRSVSPHDCYQQVLAVDYGSDAWEHITVWRDGEKYRVESEGKLVVCDGETVYIRKEVNGFIRYEYTWSAASGQFTPESEAGVSSLEDIIAEIEASSGIPEFSYDDPDKMITLDGVEDEALVRSYGILYETGIVLFESAATAEGDVLYRCYTTSYVLNPEFSADTFVIPQALFSNRP